MIQIQSKCLKRKMTAIVFRVLLLLAAINMNVFSVSGNNYYLVDTQVKNIKGTIITPDGLPISGVIVSVKDKAIQTESDENGQFYLELAQENAVIVFSKTDFAKALLFLFFLSRRCLQTSVSPTARKTGFRQQNTAKGKIE